LGRPTRSIGSAPAWTAPASGPKRGGADEEVGPGPVDHGKAGSKHQLVVLRRTHPPRSTTARARQHCPPARRVAPGPYRGSAHPGADRLLYRSHAATSQSCAVSTIPTSTTSAPAWERSPWKLPPATSRHRPDRRVRWLTISVQDLPAAIERGRSELKLASRTAAGP
jgi:hypothetical protein